MSKNGLRRAGYLGNWKSDGTPEGCLSLGGYSSEHGTRSSRFQRRKLEREEKKRRKKR